MMLENSNNSKGKIYRNIKVSGCCSKLYKKRKSLKEIIEFSATDKLKHKNSQSNDIKVLARSLSE